MHQRILPLGFRLELQELQFYFDELHSTTVSSKRTERKQIVDLVLWLPRTAEVKVGEAQPQGKPPQVVQVLLDLESRLTANESQSEDAVSRGLDELVLKIEEGDCV